MKKQVVAINLSVMLMVGLASSEMSIDELPDLTGGVIPLLSYNLGNHPMGGGQLHQGGVLSSRGRVQYQVRVKNQSGDPIDGNSLFLVVHKIQEMARLRDVTQKLEVVDADGYTGEGKPFFKISTGNKTNLEPYGESEPVKIAILNPNLLRLYPPVLRIRGIRHTVSQQFQDTLQTLVRMGILTPQEALEAVQ